MPIHSPRSSRRLAAFGLLLALLPAAATAATTSTTSPTTSPACPAPCVDDTRVRPKATIHDPDKSRLRKAEPVLGDKTDAVPTVAPADKQAPVEGLDQRPRP